MSPRWPQLIWIVRHGESAGNVARERAHAAGLTTLDLAGRDMDVPLSPLGEAQAAALGDWFAQQPSQQRPNVVLASPYVRATTTADLVKEAGGLAGDNVRLIIDERLREREFGMLDRLTTAGILERFPLEAEHRALVGKFYHRPAGGESWCDVILRLRSALDTLSLHHAGDRVLIVAHQVVVLCLRYLLEDMDERQILEIDAQADVANCSVTEYRCGDGENDRPVLVRYNDVQPVARTAPVTAEADIKVAAR